jgi:uncharacterized protein (DUF58 family)
MAATPPAGEVREWRWSGWPSRTLWPTRDGWWCLAAAVALGFAAMNTGNNLLYLLVSMLLGLIVVSGVLSEQSMRRLRFVALAPDDIQACRPALLGLRIANGKRWRASYSLTIEVRADVPRAVTYVPRLAAGGEQLVSWDATFPSRGRHRFPRVRVATRFPFALFVKAGDVAFDVEIVVYPALRPLDASARQRVAGGTAAARRRGRGVELHHLRDYRPGDEPRLIHWRSSAKTGTLLVREVEAETALDVRIVLDGMPVAGERLEAALSEAASLAVHVLSAGGAVELAGPGVHVPLAAGRGQRRRVLTALALFDARVTGGRAERVPSRGVREIRVPLA